ncbi:Seven in absentia protein family [Carex littledalei]|uniref:Seven in absentia protein family n=1 Tax=Carex littledalei TaxID=544730 RepID=A0A833QMH9_9POAL|nr:Seven in absentia protein family [Carex littledalei]
MDAILNAILDICPYQSLGCDVQFPFYEMKKHIASCPHAYLTCPMPDCGQVAQVRSHLAQHLTTEHSDFITMFKFGTQFLFAFQMDNQTKVFIEIESKHIFVIRYVVHHDATYFKFFSVSLVDDSRLKYTVLDRIGVCPLIVTSTIPTTTFNEMDGAIGEKGLSHQYRDGQSVLNCNFLVQLA